MAMTLTGQVAWITGAGSGIGLAGAQALAQAGAVVVLSGRRAELLALEADKINAAGGQAEVAVLDVADAAAVQAVAAGILARHGRIDILLNSAGLNTPNRFWKNQTVDGWRTVIGANLDGTRADYQEVHHVVERRDPAHRDHRDCLQLRDSPHGAQRERLDRGSAEAAGHVAQDRLAAPPIDRHSHERVHRAHGVGPSIGGRFRDHRDVRHVWRELRNER